MRTFFAALAGVAAASQESELNFKYMQYLAEHGKSYSSINEYMTRFALFKNAEKVIADHSVTNANYTLGHNKFSDWTEEERAQLRGRLPSQIKDTVTYHQYVGAQADSVDWRTEGAVTPVKDQGQCGSCWTFSTTGAMEGAIFLKYGTLPSLSEQELVDCVTADFGCGGGLQVDALEWLTTHNCILEDDYAYTASGYGTGNSCKYDEKTQTEWHTTGDGYIQVEANSVNAMKEAVTIMPLAVALDAAGIGFSLYKGGIYDASSCGTDMDHATLIVGYGSENGQEYWIMKNSWGTSWGEDGYMRLAITGDGPGTCGIQQDTQYPAL